LKRKTAPELGNILSAALKIRWGGGKTGSMSESQEGRPSPLSLCRPVSYQCQSGPSGRDPGGKGKKRGVNKKGRGGVGEKHIRRLFWPAKPPPGHEMERSRDEQRGKVRDMEKQRITQFKNEGEDRSGVEVTNRREAGQRRSPKRPPSESRKVGTPGRKTGGGRSTVLTCCTRDGDGQGPQEERVDGTGYKNRQS